MIRYLATAALVGAMLTAPAWAQTAPSKANNAAYYSTKSSAAPNSSGAKMTMRSHRFVAGDDSAERLNSQELKTLQQGN
jgi:hypothetical protein